MGIIGIGSSNVKTITLKNRDGSVAGSVSFSKPSVKKSKRLQYKFKRISSQIMRAKTSGSARQVMVKARGETAKLRKLLKSGEYDDNELRNAIIHAERMEKIAKKRVKHLEEEEDAKKQGGVCEAELDEELQKDSLEGLDVQDVLEMDGEELKELMEELQDAMEELEETNGLEELSQIVREDMDPEDLELLKKKHRSEELREIVEADMKYLKALFSQFEKERQEASSGVSLELGGMEVPISIMATPMADAAVMVEGGNVDVSV